MVVRFSRRKCDRIGTGAQRRQGDRLRRGGRGHRRRRRARRRVLTVTTGLRQAHAAQRISPAGPRRQGDHRHQDRRPRDVAMLQVRDGNNMLVVTTKGKMIRFHVSDVSSQGRNTWGVRIIDLEADGPGSARSRASTRRAPRRSKRNSAVLDVRQIRDQPEAVRRALATKGGAGARPELIALDTERRRLVRESEHQGAPQQSLRGDRAGQAPGPRHGAEQARMREVGERVDATTPSSSRSTSALRPSRCSCRTCPRCPKARARTTTSRFATGASRARSPSAEAPRGGRRRAGARPGAGGPDRQGALCRPLGRHGASSAR